MRHDSPAPPEPKTYEIPDNPLSARPKTVLILEDDEEFASTVRDILEEQDYRVTVVPNGAVGVQRILANDNWGENGDAPDVAATAAQVYAFPLPSGSKDAAFAVTLTPAIYTVQASGVGGATAITGNPGSTTAIGPCRKSAVEYGSATT